MNRRLGSIALALLGLLGLAPGLITDTIVIKGSNTFGEELAPNLIAVYRKLHPEVMIDLESKGTASGFAALLAGECDIASASRLVNEDELRLAHSRGIKLDDSLIGYYAVAVIVNATNQVRTLTDSQVRDIFAGKIRNWKELDGRNAPIQTYIRDAASGTHLGFQELAMAGQPYVTNAVPLKSYAAIADAVDKDPTGIGYVGINFASQARVLPLSVNGVLPTVISVNDESYPYARQIRLYVNPAKVSPAGQDFIRFVQSAAGQRLLDQIGFVRRLETRVWPPPASP